MDFSFLNGEDIKGHRTDLCSLGIDTTIPEHYECLRRFARTFTLAGSVNRKQWLTSIGDMERIGLPKGGKS